MDTNEYTLICVVKGVVVTSCIEVTCCFTVHILCAGKAWEVQQTAVWRNKQLYLVFSCAGTTSC